MKSTYPLISILVAARNEALHIAACLQALCTLDYPATRYEIIIGDDASTDGTAEIVHRFRNQYPFVHFYSIAHTETLLNGKANVLVQLACKAQGTFLLFTDADVVVPPSWAKQLVEAAMLSPKIGMVSGITIPKVPSSAPMLWQWQSVEWFCMLWTVSKLSDLGFFLTVPGNNMLLRKEAYEGVGSFHIVGASLTEDYAIGTAIVAAGWTFRGLRTPKSIAYTHPEKTWHALLHQRKRWLLGAWQGTFWVRAMIIIFLMAILGWWVFFFLHMQYAVFGGIVAWVGFLFWEMHITKQYKLRFATHSLFTFPIYLLTFSSILALHTIYSLRITWKDRPVKKRKHTR